MKKFQIKYWDVQDSFRDKFVNVKIFDDVLLKDNYVIATSDDAVAETLYIPYFSILNMKVIIIDSNHIEVDQMHP